MPCYFNMTGFHAGKAGDAALLYSRLLPIYIKCDRRPTGVSPVAFLIGRFEADNRAFAQRQMLGLAPSHARAPEFKTRALHAVAHELDDLWFREAELNCNRIESGAIFPGHLNDTVNVISRELGYRFARHDYAAR